MDDRERFLAEKAAENKIRENLETIDVTATAVARVVNNLVSEYCDRCDQLTSELSRLMRDINSGKITKYSALQLNPKCLELATEMYKMTDGLLVLGSKIDVARTQRQEAFNDAFKKVKGGTIPDKTAEANAVILDELLMEKICDRAYTVVTQKVKSANRVLEAMKKIITSITVDKEVFRKESPLHDRIDYNDLNDLDNGELPNEGEAL